MSTDATPSWSGYIFQGEVALCRAIEEINSIGIDNIEDSYCLRLEQDEDFSIKTTTIEVFQVKALLSTNSDRLSKYKDFIKELIDKYYYSLKKRKSLDDGRKTIVSYAIKPRIKPIKSILLVNSNIVDYETNLDSFNDRYKKINLDYFKTIDGEYTLENINNKLKTAIRELLNNQNIHEGDIDIKAKFCCQKICDLIKERHRTKEIEIIPFATIIDWVKNSPKAFTEKIAWYELEKILLDTFISEIEHFDLTIIEEKEEHDKLQKCISFLEKSTTKEVFDLINDHVTPHKKWNTNDIRNSYGLLLDDTSIKNIIGRAIMKAKKEPNYEKLRYWVNDSETYQLTTNNENFVESRLGKSKLQKHCETLQNSSNSLEVDCYITEHLNVSKEEMSKILNNITVIENEEGIGTNQTNPKENKVFELKSIKETIKKLNQ